MIPHAEYVVEKHEEEKINMPYGHRMELRKSLKNNCIETKPSKGYIFLLYCIFFINAIIMFLSMINIKDFYLFFSDIFINKTRSDFLN